MKTLVLMIAAILLCSSVHPGLAQTDSSGTFILPAIRISQWENGRSFTYSFEKDKNRFSLDGNKLKADTTMYKFETNVKDVISVSIKSGNHLWGGIGIGAVVGWLAGYTIGGRLLSGDSPNVPSAMLYGLLGGLSLGLVFGVIGHNSPSYDVYDFRNEDLPVKRENILKVLRTRSKQNN